MQYQKKRAWSIKEWSTPISPFHSYCRRTFSLNVRDESCVCCTVLSKPYHIYALNLICLCHSLQDTGQPMSPLFDATKPAYTAAMWQVRCRSGGTSTKEKTCLAEEAIRMRLSCNVSDKVGWQPFSNSIAGSVLEMLENKLRQII